MQLYVNDLSLAGQFPDLPAFVDAMERMMRMRRIAKQYGRALNCPRNLENALITRNHTMVQAVQQLSRERRQAVMQWFTREGPFWEDDRIHSSDDWLECIGEIVTDTSLGEAAFCCLAGEERALVSFTPSDWEYTPICVNWRSENSEDQEVEIVNHWDAVKLTEALISAPLPIMTWSELERKCIVRCPNLTFSEDCFETLRRQPFVSGAAARVLVLLDTLEKFRGCIDLQGRRTSEGTALLANHFSGGKAWFTDSSQSEKMDFEKELTFKHPKLQGESLFCTWHGKVKTPQFRVHFSDPFQSDQPLYIVYIGPKITKN